MRLIHPVLFKILSRSRQVIILFLVPAGPVLARAPRCGGSPPVPSLSHCIFFYVQFSGERDLRGPAGELPHRAEQLVTSIVLDCTEMSAVDHIAAIRPRLPAYSSHPRSLSLLKFVPWFAVDLDTGHAADHA